MLREFFVPQRTSPGPLSMVKTSLTAFPKLVRAADDKTHGA